MKNYTKPNAEIKNFISEDIVTTSGTTVNPTPNPLTVLASKGFSNSEANVSWKDIVR